MVVCGYLGQLGSGYNPLINPKCTYPLSIGSHFPVLMVGV